jgi:glycosyltransferase involved in cell wall biosynthesis
VFASPHCLVDFGSGAAIATLDGMKLLAREGFSCEAFCGSKTDAHEEILLEESLSRQGMPYEARRATIGDMEARLIFARQESVPVTLFQGMSTRAMGLERAESETFLKALQAFLDRQRPDVLVTYGSDPLTMEIIYRAKVRDIPVVFWLHNFSYHDTWPFRHVDYVLVPSETARQHYWEYLGMACRQLPNVADPRRVLAAKREPQYLTFVNPDPAKGVRVFARIAEELGRRRPDIPILVVEGRSTLRQPYVDDLTLRGLPNVRTMENTPDPRQFYSVSKLVLMPSLWRESSPLVAIEAMANGIPVLASDRGGLPETVGEGGFLFAIPAR